MSGPAPITREQFGAMTVLGIDHGLARIGIALKPAGQMWALPLRTLETPDERSAMEAVRALIGEYQANAVVVGLPLDADPRQAALVRRFTRKTREGVTGVRWLFTDELLTSEAAEQMADEARAMNRRRGSREAACDEIAAKLILETYAGRLPAGE